MGVCNGADVMDAEDIMIVGAWFILGTFTLYALDFFTKGGIQ